MGKTPHCDALTCFRRGYCESTLNKAEPARKRLLGGLRTELKDIMQFVDAQDERLKEHYIELNDREKIVLARTVKLAEELGELSQAVLAHL